MRCFFSVLLAFVIVAATSAGAKADATVKSNLNAAGAAKICIPPGSTYVLGLWNAYGGYLLCHVHDSLSGTAELFKQTSTGSWVLKSHGGGDIPYAGLIFYGVPSATAHTLINGLHN